MTQDQRKFDRLIVAVAAIAFATVVYSDDEDDCGYTREAGMKAYRLQEIELLSENPQTKIEISTDG